MSMYGNMRNRSGGTSSTQSAALERSAVSKVDRGEVYWVRIPFSTGSEMRKTRPAIVISNDERNYSRNTVTMVFCSESPQQDVPSHVSITATGTRSTVLCDHIYTVDKSRIGAYIGICTRREMDAIENGIRSALGLDLVEEEETEVQAPVTGEKTAEQAWEGCSEMTRLQVERDTYKSLYEGLLDRMTMERKVSA